MRPWIALAALALGFALGFAVGGAGGAAPEEFVPRRDLERVERRLDDAEARAVRAEQALAVAERGRAAVPPDGGEPPANGDPGRPPRLPESERAQRVRDLVAKVSPKFDEGDGEGLLEILRSLAQIVPEGREAAMEVALRVHEDLQGPKSLGLDEVGFYSTLGDSAVRELMVWSLANPSPAGFRVLAAWSLPWVLPREGAIETLTGALLAESDAGVQQALVASLGKMRDSRVDAALGAIFRDPARDPAIRERVTFALATSPDPEIVALLVRAAESDPDERVRAAARIALPLARPPVDGYALTVVYPDGAGAAAGLRPGDIVVRYDGTPVVTTEQFLSAIEEAASPPEGAAETVTVLVVREGHETTLAARRGRLGVQGRTVRKQP